MNDASDLVIETTEGQENRNDHVVVPVPNETAVNQVPLQDHPANDDVHLVKEENGDHASEFLIVLEDSTHEVSKVSLRFCIPVPRTGNLYLILRFFFLQSTVVFFLVWIL
jgi:hypothetical protein